MKKNESLLSEDFIGKVYSFHSTKYAVPSKLNFDIMMKRSFYSYLLKGNMLDGYKIKFNVSVSYITSYFIVADNQNYRGEMLYKLILRCLKVYGGI